MIVIVLIKRRIYFLVLSIDMAQKPPLPKFVTIWEMKKDIDSNRLKHNESMKTDDFIMILKMRSTKIPYVTICCNLLWKLVIKNLKIKPLSNLASRKWYFREIDHLVNKGRLCFAEECQIILRRNNGIGRSAFRKPLWNHWSKRRCSNDIKTTGQMIDGN